MRFTHRTPVRFSDTDAMGHVNNARFLTYLEDARIAFFRDVAADGEILGGAIVARIEVDYVRPIRFDPELLAVELWVERVGGRSFTLGYRVLQHGEVAARATSVIVAYDYAAEASRALTDAERNRLQSWVDSPAQTGPRTPS